jgi:hypothetical protein
VRLLVQVVVEAERWLALDEEFVVFNALRLRV